MFKSIQKLIQSLSKLLHANSKLTHWNPNIVGAGLLFCVSILTKSEFWRQGSQYVRVHNGVHQLFRNHHDFLIAQTNHYFLLIARKNLLSHHENQNKAKSPVKISERPIYYFKLNIICRIRSKRTLIVGKNELISRT